MHNYNYYRHNFYYYIHSKVLLHKLSSLLHRGQREHKEWNIIELPEQRGEGAGGGGGRGGGKEGKEDSSRAEHYSDQNKCHHEQKMAEERMVESSERIVKTINETLVMGQKTSEELRRQEEALVRTEKHVDTIISNDSLLSKPPAPSQPNPPLVSNLPPASVKPLDSTMSPTTTGPPSNTPASAKPPSNMLQPVPVTYTPLPPTSIKKGGAKQGSASNLDQRTQLAYKKMEESSARSVQTLHNTLQIGQDTTEELERQAEALDRTERHLDDMQVDLSMEHKTKRHVGRRSPLSSISRAFSKKKKPSKVTDPNPVKGTAQTLQKKSSATSFATGPNPISPPSTAGPKSVGNKVVDGNLDEMEKILHQLKDIGQEMGDQLDDSSIQVNRINQKSGHVGISLRDANKRLVADLQKIEAKEKDAQKKETKK